MNLNKMTESLQTAFLSAQTLAVQHGHQEIDDLHLVLSLVRQDNNLANSIFSRLGVSTTDFIEDLTNLLSKKPQVSGSGTEQGKVYITATLQKVLAQAAKQMAGFDDEYLSVEHLLIAAIDTVSSEAGAAMMRAGLTRKKLVSAIKEIRGNQTVTSQNPEATYEVLKKYGRDLVEEARAGKGEIGRAHV